MKIVVFGLSISSAWGNGHATLLRGLFRALHRQGHEIHFFERDVPYYAQHRDGWTFPYVHLHFYSEWREIAESARRQVSDAGLGVVTSYCPDAAAAADLILDADLWRTVFYDMDTPVTFARLDAGENVPYIPSRGLADFDLVLSYTGGRALERLQNDLGARVAAPLYGWVDPDEYYRVDPAEEFRCDLSYLGTYSADRQPAVEELLLRPAGALESKTFIIAGAMYPERSHWPKNVRHLEHVSPPQHRAFYSSGGLTLNITRGPMARMGFCPSGRLFEATACGAAVLSDWWEGLETFFELGEEIIVVRDGSDVGTALQKPDCDLDRIAQRGRARTLDCHTAAMRARELLQLLERAAVDHAPASVERAS